VGADLARLGLTWKVTPRRVDDTHVELKVGRLPRAQQGGAQDLVNIADVGFGASQVLPVVVALRTARPGQVVHIEQPELHLRPNAQVAMADLLLRAAKRGVRVIVETHSSVLLKKIQVELATEGNGVDPELVALPGPSSPTLSSSSSIEKDAPHVSLAMATDRRVLSLDDKQRDLLSKLIGDVPALKALLWANPRHPEAREWLDASAPERKALCVPPPGRASTR